MSDHCILILWVTVFYFKGIFKCNIKFKLLNQNHLKYEQSTSPQRVAVKLSSVDRPTAVKRLRSTDLEKSIKYRISSDAKSRKSWHLKILFYDYIASMLNFEKVLRWKNYICTLNEIFKFIEVSYLFEYILTISLI